jgi:hypothetical protein
MEERVIVSTTTQTRVQPTVTDIRSIALAHLNQLTSYTNEGGNQGDYGIVSSMGAGLQDIAELGKRKQDPVVRAMATAARQALKRAGDNFKGKERVDPTATPEEQHASHRLRIDSQVRAGAIYQGTLAAILGNANAPSSETSMHHMRLSVLQQGDNYLRQANLPENDNRNAVVQRHQVLLSAGVNAIRTISPAVARQSGQAEQVARAVALSAGMSPVAALAMLRVQD